MCICFDFSSLQIIFQPRTNIAFPICTLSLLLNFCADLLSGRRSRQWHHRFCMFQSLHTPLIFSFAALLRVDIAFLIISLRLLILSSVQGCLRRQGPQHLLNDLIACDAICAQCLDATYPCKMLSATSPLNLHHHLASLEAGWFLLVSFNDVCFCLRSPCSHKSGAAWCEVQQRHQLVHSRLFAPRVTGFRRGERARFMFARNQADRELGCRSARTEGKERPPSQQFDILKSCDICDSFFFE